MFRSEGGVGVTLSTLTLLLGLFRGQPVICMKESLSEMGPLGERSKTAQPVKVVQQSCDFY